MAEMEFLLTGSRAFNYEAEHGSTYCVLFLNCWIWGRRKGLGNLDETERGRIWTGYIPTEEGG